MGIGKKTRDGNRKSRESFKKGVTPDLGYYIIVTDTKETEFNYIDGLRSAIPQELQRRLTIRISKTETKSLVDEALRIASEHFQYSQPWIIFDRDQVQNFDDIIREAERKRVKVGWTNPCLEEWFCAYFGKMPSYPDSVACCKGFEVIFQSKTQQKYEKDDTDIYRKLNQFGNEEEAIRRAKEKLRSYPAEKKPSEMCPCTTVHILVEEIKSKTK